MMGAHGSHVRKLTDIREPNAWLEVKTYPKLTDITRIDHVAGQTVVKIGGPHDYETSDPPVGIWGVADTRDMAEILFPAYQPEAAP